ncbi:MAG: PilN domain-containing protein, partial [Desulfuromonadaceae bacterium]
MKLTLNLASRSYLNRRALRFFYLLAIGMLLLLGAFNLYGYMQGRDRIAQLTVRLAELDRTRQNPEVRTRKMTPQEQEQLNAEVEFANQILRMDAFRWTELLDRLEQVVPEQVSVRGIRPDFGEGSLSLNGYARSVDDLRRFLDNLHA